MDPIATRPPSGPTHREIRELADTFARNSTALATSISKYTQALDSALDSINSLRLALHEMDERMRRLEGCSSEPTSRTSP